MRAPEESRVPDMGIYSSARRLMVHQNCVSTIDHAVTLLTNPQAQVGIVEADRQFLIITPNSVENPRWH